MQPANKLGNKSSDCFPPDCSSTCSPCDHIDFVYSESEGIIGNPTRLLEIVNAMLSVHQECVAEICSPNLEICNRADVVSFACVQCVLIDTNCITYDDSIYDGVNCNDSCLSLINHSSCDPSFVDLSQDRYSEILEKIVSALENLEADFASAQLSEDFMSQIIDDFSFINYNEGCYDFYVGTLSEEYLEILPLFKRILPIPFGACARFFTDCVI